MKSSIFKQLRGFSSLMSNSKNYWNNTINELGENICGCGFTDIKNEENKVEYRILASQILLRNNIETDSVERIVLSFANDESLEVMHNSISKNSEFDFFYCSTIIYKTKTKEIIHYEPNEKYIDSLLTHPINLFSANVIGAPSATIFRRYLNVKFDKSLIWLVDIEFYAQVILKYKIFRILDRLIVTCVDLDTQLTTSLKDNRKIEIFELFYCFKTIRISTYKCIRVSCIMH
jgi:hypothetical protein